VGLQASSKTLKWKVLYSFLSILENEKPLKDVDNDTWSLIVFDLELVNDGWDFPIKIMMSYFICKFNLVGYLKVFLWKHVNTYFCALMVIALSIVF